MLRRHIATLVVLFVVEIGPKWLFGHEKVANPCSKALLFLPESSGILAGIKKCANFIKKFYIIGES